MKTRSRWLHGLLMIVLLPALAPAQALAGWKWLSSLPAGYDAPPFGVPSKFTPGGKCLIAVPDDWIADRTTDRGQAHSPDGRAEARVQEHPPTGSFAERKAFILTDFKNRRTQMQRLFHQDLLSMQLVKNTPALLYEIEISQQEGGVKTWKLLSAGTPLCSAEISVVNTSPLPNEPPSVPETVRKLQDIAGRIAASFRPAP